MNYFCVALSLQSVLFLEIQFLFIRRAVKLWENYLEQTELEE